LNVAIGLSVAASSNTSIGAAGNVANNNIANDTTVTIDETTIDASGTVAALANSNEVLRNYGGALSVSATTGSASAALGSTVVVNTITGNTSAIVQNSNIIALGTGSGVDVQDYTISKDDPTSRGSNSSTTNSVEGADVAEKMLQDRGTHTVTGSDATKTGFVVNANANHTMRDISVTAGIRFADNSSDDQKRVRKYMSIPYIISSIEKKGILEFQFLSLDRNGEEEYNNMRITPLFKGRNDILLSTRANVDAIVREGQKKEKKLKKAMEEAKKANEARADFFAGISHDMRTPMNAIIGMSALGVDESEDEAIKKYFTNIDASAHFLLGLINDALDSSQIEKNVLKLTYEPYCMDEFRHYVDSVVRSLCDAKKIEFNMVVPETAAKCVSTDKLRFNQIFFNLLSNAVKFTPENGKIDFIIEIVSKENGVLIERFIVKDTGIGMSKDFQKNMFNQFAREKAHGDMSTGGTGLGLFITKYVVELMGGTISVNSEVGKGSEFIVELALQEVDSVGVHFTTLEKLSEDDFDTILKDKRVLLCEDIEMNSQIASRLLEKKCMIVECVPDGQAGLEKFNNSDEGYYDVVLMDIRMPVMDGLEATKFIRNLERMDSKKVPIIAMSANTHKKDVEAALSAGMSTHIGKPFDVKELYRVISLELIKE
jgi:signal transduction histidine kinase/ActR/RegA family two-component response regulator